MAREHEIEVFVAGTPASKGLTAAHVAEVAACYDPKRNPAPVVMGHPADDDSAPAFGAISKVRADGPRLFATIKNLAKEAVDGVRGSRILNRSAAFWHPNHPSNPTPGKYNLRHIGLLGGAAPAIPNMAPLHFSADGDDAPLVCEGDAGEAMIFAAPATAPDLTDPNVIQGIATAVAAILKPQNKEFSAVTEQELKAAQDKLAADKAALKEAQDKLAADQTTFAADKEAIEKKAKADREAGNATFAAELVDGGKFPAGLKDDLALVLNQLPADTKLQFSADDKEAPVDALKRILSTAVPVMQFSVKSPKGNPPKGDDDNSEQTALAKANARAEEAWKGK